jgi:hypothetical protein
MGTDHERESNGDRTDASERYRELGRRSGEARRRKKEQREAQREKEQLEPATEREQATADIEEGMQAHREIVRTSGNAAARSRSASELIRLARELERLRFGSGPMSVEDAREQLASRFDALDQRRRANGEVCQACSGAGYVQRPGGGRVAGKGVAGGVVLPSPVEPEQISEGPSPWVVDGSQGELRGDIRSLNPGRFGWGSSGGDVA